MVQEQEVYRDESVLTYDPNLHYGWVTNQPYALSINEDFDPYGLDTWPSDVGLRATRAHPTYLINVAALVRTDGLPIPRSEIVEISIHFTRFKDGLAIWPVIYWFRFALQPITWLFSSRKLLRLIIYDAVGPTYFNDYSSHYVISTLK